MTRQGTALRIVQLAAISALVACAALALRYLQWPANFELAWYDAMVRFRLATGWNEQPVVVYALLDTDHIKPPIEDGKLAEVLKKLCDAKPRAIGIDLLRDRAVGAGIEQLNAVFAECPVIIGASLFGRHQNQYVAPPDALTPPARHGFSDVMVDPDGVVRRGFLALDRGRSGGQEQAEFSLALRLARLYLAGQDPPVKVVSTALSTDPLSGIRIGPTHVPRLNPWDGGYVSETSGGYQVLIDYREPLRSVDRFGLSAILSDSFEPGDVRGRVVLIGNMTAEAKDHFVTPVGRGTSDEDRTPGVFLHAFMTDQLIRYGLDVTRPMRFLPEWLEILLTFVLSLCAAVGGWLTRRRYIAAACAAAILIMLAASYLIFRAGWWFPPVSAIIAVVPAAIVGHTRGRVRGRVFLSYAREDEKRVRKMQLKLQRSGFEAWMDRTDIEPGERWEGAIRQALHDADCFVLCVTSRSVSKEGVLHQEMREALDIWSQGLDSRYRIIPAIIEKKVALPKELDQFQWVDLSSEKDWGRFVRALCRRNGTTRR